MKRFSCTAGALALVLVFVLAVDAYYPHLIVRECPHCKARVVQEATVSGNTIGAVYFTDGKREAKMLPNHPWLAKCPACGGLFWVDEAAEIDAGFEAAEGKHQVMKPSEAELLNFVSATALPGNKERYVRQCAWWTANDAWRHALGVAPKFSEAQLKSLEALSGMLDEAKEVERMFKAEIARELGRFDACRQLLSQPFEGNLQRFADFIRRLADEGDRGVRPVTF
jgi:hypothetical protein